MTPAPIAPAIPNAVTIRPAEMADLPAITQLIAAHAEYERSSADLTGLEQRLLESLIEEGRRAASFVAVVGALEGPTLAGYTTASPEYSTWSGREYLHMDTLFVTAQHRGLGIGELLVNAVTAFGQSLGIDEMQWQTPAWNQRAIPFYERLGAVASTKERFRLALSSSHRVASHRETLDRFTLAWAKRDLVVLTECLHRHVRYAPSVRVPGAPFEGLDHVLEAIQTLWGVDDGAVAEFGPPLQTLDTITRTWTYHFADRHDEHGVDIFTFENGLIRNKDSYRRSPQRETAAGATSAK